MALIEDPKGKRPPYDLRVEAPFSGPDAAYVQAVRSPTEYLQIPERITGIVETEHYKITIVTGIDDELRTIVDRLTVERKPGAPAINGDVLNRLGCGDVLKHMVERGSFHWVRDDEREVWTLADLSPDGVKDAPYYALRSFRRPSNATIDAQAQEAAQLFREAREQRIPAPRKHVADTLHMSTRTVTRRLDRAVVLGYLREDER